MNKYQLEVFLTVAQTKQISSAAKLLHLSQPAVSSQIKALENHFGSSLFERTKHGVELTEIGHVAVKHAMKIIVTFNELDQEIDQILNIDNQKIHIGATDTVGNYALPCSLWTFKQRYQTSKITLEVDSLQSILRQLADGQLDIAVVEGIQYNKTFVNKFVEKTTGCDEVIIIIPGNEVWTKNIDSLQTIKDLKKLPFVLPKEGLGLAEPFLEVLSNKQLTIEEFNVVSELGSIGSIKSSVQAGLGFSLCSRMAVQKELEEGSMVEISLTDFHAPLHFTLVYRNDSFLSLLSKRFIQFISVPDEIQFCK